MKEDTLIQLYWAIFEAWSAQVDSYWTRTNYFAAFEIAAIGGTWVVLNANDLTVGRYSLVLASFLTASWIFSNVKSHDYLMYWWKALAEIEAMPGWEQKKPDFVSGHPKRKRNCKDQLKFRTTTSRTGSSRSLSWLSGSLWFTPTGMEPPTFRRLTSK